MGKPQINLVWNLTNCIWLLAWHGYVLLRELANACARIFLRAAWAIRRPFVRSRQGSTSEMVFTIT